MRRLIERSDFYAQNVDSAMFQGRYLTVSVMLGFVKVDRKERFLFSDSLLRVTLFFSEKCGPCVAPRAISNCFGRVFYFFCLL